MTDLAMRVDVWVVDWGDEASLWRRHGVPIFHMEIQDECVCRVCTTGGLLYALVTIIVSLVMEHLAKAEENGELTPLNHNLPERHIRTRHIDIVVRMRIGNNILDLVRLASAINRKLRDPDLGTDSCWT